MMQFKFLFFTTEAHLPCDGTSFLAGTNQLVGLINCEDTAVDFLPHIDMSIGKECDELLAFILHACEGDGDFVIIQMFRQDGQQTRLDHTGHHLALLQRDGVKKNWFSKKPLQVYILKKIY